MKRLLHLVLAVAMLMTHMGFAAAGCDCPSMPVPVTQTDAETCPMSGEPGCQCCGPISEPSAEKSLNSGCLQAPAIDSHQAVMGCCVPVVDAFVAVQSFEFPLPAVAIQVVCQQLVVPRIRPPNTASHGLRAPPLG